MKRLLTPIAAAVGIALASAAAHAQLAPIPTVDGQPDGYASNAPGSTYPGPDTLMLAVWDGSGNTKDNEVVNLNNYLYSQLSTAVNGNLSPSSPTGSFVTESSPDSAVYSGSVLQLNFGVIPNWSTFSSLSDVVYGVYAGNITASAAGGQGGEYTWAAGASPTFTAQAMSTVSQHLTAEAGTLPAGINYDNTGTQPWSAQGPNLGSGSLGSTGETSGGVGTALNFYYQPYEARGTVNPAEEGNSVGAGFWFLNSTTGDLTWNVPEAVSAVPLPAAAWLLASGLAGLGAIARRRRTGGAALA
ncbi:MAG TPA: VPLPA-CTERM sorting domain-containing protein [Steroidobacteraceae bacterium]|nr:VPLPA-CTERM sorting domain-containing protein [Steroidobacteraceae bacterium]